DGGVALAVEQRDRKGKGADVEVGLAQIQREAARAQDRHIDRQTVALELARQEDARGVLDVEEAAPTQAFARRLAVHHLDVDAGAHVHVMLEMLEQADLARQRQEEQPREHANGGTAAGVGIRVRTRRAYRRTAGFAQEGEARLLRGLADVAL